jgi:hypothetical protein
MPGHLPPLQLSSWSVLFVEAAIASWRAADRKEDSRTPRPAAANADDAPQRRRAAKAVERKTEGNGGLVYGLAIALFVAFAITLSNLGGKGLVTSTLVLGLSSALALHMSGQVMLWLWLWKIGKVTMEEVTFSILALSAVAIGSVMTVVMRVLSDRFDLKYHIDGK